MTRNFLAWRAGWLLPVYSLDCVVGAEDDGMYTQCFRLRVLDLFSCMSRHNLSHFHFLARNEFVESGF